MLCSILFTDKMDVILDVVDEYFFTPYVYPETWPEENLWRQFLTLNIVVDLGAALLYLTTAGTAYYTTFDHRYLTHPQMLEVNSYWKNNICFWKLLII